MRPGVIIAACLAIGSPGMSAAADWHDGAINAIVTEPSVVEATFPQDASLWVSVRDDGTNRDGFASYLCLVLSDAAPPKGTFVIIKVLDAYSLANGEMKTIGRGECTF